MHSVPLRLEGVMEDGWFGVLGMYGMGVSACAEWGCWIGGGISGGNKGLASSAR